MATKSSNNWLLVRVVLPATVFAAMLMGCGACRNVSDKDNDGDRSAFVVDSLLKENRKLTDSLATVGARLDSCESAHKVPKKRCPCDKKPAPTPVKPKPVKPKPTPKPAPKPAPKPVKVVVTPAPAQPINQVVVDGDNNGTIVVGNNNTVNNNTVVVNGATQVVVDTMARVKRARYVFVGAASAERTYTK